MGNLRFPLDITYHGCLLFSILGVCYFSAIRTQNRECLFWGIVDGENAVERCGENDSGGLG